MPDLFGNPTWEDSFNIPLEAKIKNSIAIVQHYAPHAEYIDSRGFSLGNSFGKDSIVVKKILQMAGVKFFDYRSNTTIDPPELIYYGREHHKDTLILHPPKNLIRHMVDEGKGLPTRIGRWCCDIYKEQAFIETFRVLGVRADESKRRKGLWTELKIHDKSKMPILNPILYWTDKDVWDFIADEKIPYCELYDEPEICRLGCVGCPLAGKDQMKFEFERWPAFHKAWMKGCEDMFNFWDGKKGKRGNERAFMKFGSWELYWMWWISEGRIDSRDADCQLFLW